jgi:ketosteroid isomerase-like protein
MAVSPTLAQVRQQLNEYLTVWATPSVDRLLACFSDDAVLEVVPLGLVQQGKPALRTFFSRLSGVSDVRRGTGPLAHRPSGRRAAGPRGAGVPSKHDEQA